MEHDIKDLVYDSARARTHTYDQFVHILKNL